MKNNLLDVFKTFFAGGLGIIGAYATVALFSITFISIGLYLLNTYNKKGTKLLKDLQPLQYLGLILCFIGCLPFMQYFIMGFLYEGGQIAMYNIFDN